LLSLTIPRPVKVYRLEALAVTNAILNTPTIIAVIVLENIIACLTFCAMFVCLSTNEELSVYYYATQITYRKDIEKFWQFIAYLHRKR
jgi:hypothetical protein